MTATASVNNMRIITVVMGEPDSQTRNSEVTSILDYVYAQYSLNKIVTKDTIIDTMNVERAKIEKVDIIPLDDVSDLYKKSDGVKNITYDTKIDLNKAPIKKGDIVGSLSILENGKEFKKVNLTVKEDIKKANIFELYFRYLKNLISFNM